MESGGAGERIGISLAKAQRREVRRIHKIFLTWRLGESKSLVEG
jgi:hypothetical protein